MDISVGIATGYMLDGWGSIPGQGQVILIVSTTSRPALEPTQRLSNRYGDSFLGEVKRQGREADHLLSSSAQVKNG
jgi:hypothetical protein